MDDKTNTICDQKTLDEFRSKMIKDAFEVSDAKSIEYTISNIDKHYNFKSIADRLGVSPEQVLMTYVLKHIDAICNDAKTGKVVSSETIYSRCIDVINYMVLLASLKILPHNQENKNEQNNDIDKGGAVHGYGSRDASNAPEPAKWSHLQKK
tara:strand:- start:97 stop:552 length:456 start_codon:yes stop_codon:yes gene_type:complete